MIAEFLPKNSHDNDQTIVNKYEKRDRYFSVRKLILHTRDLIIV